MGGKKIGVPQHAARSPPIGRLRDRRPQPPFDDVYDDRGRKFSSRRALRPRRRTLAATMAGAARTSSARRRRARARARARRRHPWPLEARHRQQVVLPFLNRLGLGARDGRCGSSGRLTPLTTWPSTRSVVKKSVTCSRSAPMHCRARSRTAPTAPSGRRPARPARRRPPHPGAAW